MTTQVRAGAADAVPIESVEARAYTVPTEQPEADGTLEWDATTVLVVQVHAGERTGIGYSYTQTGAVDVVTGKLANAVAGMDALAVGAVWAAMIGQVRNVGNTGVAATAISAVDVALWDLKARLLDVPLVVALDAVHDSTPIYGSGGFCNYTDEQLASQLSGWAADGIGRVKMKIGREPDRDPHRLAVARQAIGDGIELFSDANGALTRAQARGFLGLLADHGVRWFEEPVSSDDLAGLRMVRDHAPGGMDIAAGEYGWNLPYFEQMLAADALDCLQADVTRCGGITGFLRVGALCDARSLDLSAHCAPQVSAQVCTAVWHLRHLEFFHDHNRIEHMFFDGCLEPQAPGVLEPDRSRPGLGLALREPDVDRYRVR